MGHLAVASDIPAIFVMQGVADLAFDHAARVIALDRLEAIGAAMFLVHCELDGGSPVQAAFGDRLGAAAHRVDGRGRSRDHGRAQSSCALHGSERPSVLGPGSARQRCAGGNRVAAKGGNGRGVSPAALALGVAPPMDGVCFQTRRAIQEVSAAMTMCAKSRRSMRAAAELKRAAGE